MFFLLLASFLWGTSFIAGKYAYHMADPVVVVLFRLVIASLILLPSLFKIIKQRSTNPPLPYASLFFLGFLTFPLTFLLQFIGLEYTSASSAVTMLGVEPLMVVFVGYLFFKEKLVIKDIFLGILALIGVVLVVGIAHDPAINFWGCFLVLCSTVIVAFWVRLSKIVLAKVDVKTYTTVTVFSGMITCLPIAPFLAKSWQIDVSLSGTLAILYLGIGCSLWAVWLWNKGLEKVKANTSGIFLALEPVFGVVMAVILLNESIGFTVMTGIVLVVAATMISVFTHSNKTTLAAQENNQLA